MPTQAEALGRTAICWQLGVCQPLGWPLTQPLSRLVLIGWRTPLSPFTDGETEAQRL